MTLALTWPDHLARLDIVHTVLARAAKDPGSPTLFDDLPDLDRLFGGPAGVLSILKWQWDNAFPAALAHAVAAGGSSVDAYRALATQLPTHRALLDRHRLATASQTPASSM